MPEPKDPTDPADQSRPTRAGPTPVRRDASLRPSHSARDCPRRFRNPAYIGPYRIIAVLGRGGQGTVYRATHPTLGRDVAVKIADGELPEAAQARLFEEGRVLAGLDDPGLICVYDAGLHDGRPYVAFEYVQGRSLAEKVRGTSLPALEAVELVASLAATLERVHRAGILHRDLKPTNVLIDSAGTPRLMDFGSALLTLPYTNTVVEDEYSGTPSYMSPEQATGLRTGASDCATLWPRHLITYHRLAAVPGTRAACGSRLDRLRDPAAERTSRSRRGWPRFSIGRFADPASCHQSAGSSADPGAPRRGVGARGAGRGRAGRCGGCSRSSSRGRPRLFAPPRPLAGASRSPRLLAGGGVRIDGATTFPPARQDEQPERAPPRSAPRRRQNQNRDAVTHKHVPAPGADVRRHSRARGVRSTRPDERDQPGGHHVREASAFVATGPFRCRLESTWSATSSTRSRSGPRPHRPDPRPRACSTDCCSRLIDASSVTLATRQSINTPDRVLFAQVQCRLRRPEDRGRPGWDNEVLTLNAELVGASASAPASGVGDTRPPAGVRFAHLPPHRRGTTELARWRIGDPWPSWLKLSFLPQRGLTTQREAVRGRKTRAGKARGQAGGRSRSPNATTQTWVATAAAQTQLNC